MLGMIILTTLLTVLVVLAMGAQMTAATAAITNTLRDGVEVSVPMQANLKVLAGWGVCIGDPDRVGAGVAGHAKEALAADADDHRFLGIAVNDADNTGGGAAAAKSVRVQIEGVVKLIFGSVAITDVGKDAYLLDNQTAQVGETNAGYQLGKIVEWIDGTHAYVELRRPGNIRRFTVTAEYLAASVDKRVFMANRPTLVRRIAGTVDAAGTDAGAVSCQPVKVASGTAVSAGTALTTATMDLKGTANTKQNLTLSATAAALLLDVDDCLGLNFTGVLTAATGVVTFELLEL